MKAKSLWLLVLFPLVNSMCFGEVCASSIPQTALASISDFHDWRVVKVADLPADDQRLWGNSRGGGCPGVAAGNFRDNGLSFAVALIRNQPTGELQEQLILLSAEGNSFRREVVVKPTIVVSPFVVWTVPPGRAKGTDQDEPFQITHDSFVYEKMEALATQYYFDGARLRSIATAN